MYEGQDSFIFLWPLAKRNPFCHNIWLGKWKKFALPSKRPNGGKYFWTRVRRSGPRCPKRVQKMLGALKGKVDGPTV